MIPDSLRDTTMHVTQPDKLHVYCIVLRLFIGILIYYFGSQHKLIVSLLCAAIVVFFSYKWHVTGNKTWKEYVRPVVTYGIVGAMTAASSEKKNPVGLLVVTDALLSLQMRHVYSNIGTLLAKT